MNDLKVITEHRNQILSILEPMMVDFKREINEVRAEGASQNEIEAMLHELEACYARSDNAEGMLVLAVLREAARLRYPITFSPALLGWPVSA
jgi:hypothetical protein